MADGHCLGTSLAHCYTAYNMINNNNDDVITMHVVLSTSLLTVTVYNIINSNKKCKKVKSFPSYQAHKAALISVSLALSSARHQFTLWDHRYEANTSHSAAVYIPLFDGIHCAYAHSDGQAELT